MFVALGIQHAVLMGQVFNIRPVQLYNIFPHYLINGTIFGKTNLLNMKRVLIFLTIFA